MVQLLKQGSWSAGMMSLCRTTWTLSLTHAGTWLSRATTRWTFSTKGMNFPIPRSRYGSVPQSRKRFASGAWPMAAA